jgi:hypothetical protein
MKKDVSRKALQYFIGFLAAAPLVSGIVGLSGIFNPLFFEHLPANLLLDSNLRFLNAMSVGVALSFYFLIPVIEKETFTCRILCATIFLAGIGRLISIVDLGIPPIPLLVFLALELTGPILIVFWQNRIASQAK